MEDSISRFSRTVEHYIKYRPGYPQAIVDLLRAECHLADGAVVADIGAGTGLLTELFLKNGYRAFGVEPNDEMRAAGQQLLQKYPGFTSVTGMAEATTLANRSIDLITAGQAFHWFDRARTRLEFERILKLGGWVVLCWNISRTDTPFLAAHDQLWQKYGMSRRPDPTEAEEGLRAFYAPGAVRARIFDNVQTVAYDGLQGRALSASAAPQAGTPERAALLNELASIFQAHQRDGQVAILYDCRVYYGQLQP
jgi:SAM-dependent methyltransferase